MDTDNMSTSFLARVKRAVRTAGLEIARAFQGAVHLLRIIVFLHSAKDFPSVLRLYGIEDSSETE
jgi:hypothetical protein